MILIGIGANLRSPAGSPLATCRATVSLIESSGIRIVRRSRWIESSPVPPSAQPWFINGVARVETSLGPEDLLAFLHVVEAAFGRVRTIPNAPRTLDLDLLAYRHVIRTTDPILPHPRLHERAFVVLPLVDIAPDWSHPTSGQTPHQLAAALPSVQQIRWLSGH
ncbi:MAG: 2-amino-4-hydroxy-6-hydroxymethyldihydropteridine diphosphokinase [Rhodospirillaceae bacterium]|nr:MAG: 2-amino-4-hydroxy-6-hydroxymethyldihydropteridine diphosphokinase [Rhodospirillaceae bacterium]